MKTIMIPTTNELYEIPNYEKYELPNKVVDYIKQLEEESKNNYFIHMKEWAKAIGNNAKLQQIIDKAIEELEEEIEQSDGCIYVELPEELYIKKLQKYLDILRNESEIQYLGYSDKECINCGRLRVEKYSDGTEICEKCNFDQNKKEYVLRSEDNV